MRYHDQCPVQVLGDGARPAISVFRSASYTLLITLEPLERHAYGSQAFMAVAGDSFMVVVPPLARRSEPTMCAHSEHGRQSVNYHGGVWHHPMLALDCTGDLLVVDRTGPGNNCNERDLPEPIIVIAE